MRRPPRDQRRIAHRLIECEFALWVRQRCRSRETRNMRQQQLRVEDSSIVAWHGAQPLGCLGKRIAKSACSGQCS
jgi:hypothetical protein